MAKSQKPDTGEAVLETLTTGTRQLLTRLMRGDAAGAAAYEDTDSEEAATGAAVLRQMSISAKARLSQAAPVHQEKEVESEGRYGIVECPDGEWAQLRMFKTVEGLARRLQQLEGTDTVVWCFYGTPLPLTRGPQRYIQLPHGRLFSVPGYDGGPCGFVDVETLPEPPAAQKDGHVGYAELAQPVTANSDDDEVQDDYT